MNEAKRKKTNFPLWSSAEKWLGSVFEELNAALLSLYESAARLILFLFKFPLLPLTISLLSYLSSWNFQHRRDFCAVHMCISIFEWWPSGWLIARHLSLLGWPFLFLGYAEIVSELSLNPGGIIFLSSFFLSVWDKIRIFCFASQSWQRTFSHLKRRD